MIAREMIVVPPLRLTLSWEDGKLAGMAMAWAKDESAGQAPLSPMAEELALALGRHLSGEPTIWPEPPLAWERLTPYARRVLTTLKKDVGWGECITYGGLAARAGNRRAARAVGGVMASNPWPLVIPCHRVLAAGFRLGGFGPGPEMKRFLLDLEDIPYRR